MLPRHVPGPFSMPRGPDVAMIDAHCHFWRLNQNDCTWPPPELTAIHRDFFPDDWQRAANAVGIDAAIAVQSQPSDGDTDWLLELTCDDPRMAEHRGSIDRHYWVWVTAPEFYLDTEGNDRPDLEPRRDLQPEGLWTCHRDTVEGDLALLYRSRIRKDIGYLLEALRPA